MTCRSSNSVWRLVQGHHLGTDFHDPRGFGVFQVAAMLWRLLGPHYYVLRASADFFALVIVVCACIVATRQLRHAAGLAALFCITVAFEASGPSIYGLTQDFGMAGSYNRLLTSGLVVLFVQSFTNNLDSRRERDYIDYLTTAFLLNVLFLVKISAVVLGLALVAGGCIVRGGFSRSIVKLSLVLLFLTVMLAIDFVITGTSLAPVIQDYRLAAQARAGSYSVLDALWFASQLPVVGVGALIALFAAWPPGQRSRGNMWRCFSIIAFYWVCQVALNMSNATNAPELLFFLAPAAVVAVATWTDTSDTAVFGGHLWSKFHSRRLHEISVREVIPLVVSALVFMPEALSSLRAIKIDYQISRGTAETIAVTANNGVTFDVLSKEPSTIDPSVMDKALSINRAIQAIEGLGASREKIANLDFMNPYPALFLAPAPKGVSVYWDFGNNVPQGYKLDWREIIGDACIVTEPKQSMGEQYSKPLIDAMQLQLASAFALIYQDELWNIWKRSSGCGETGGPSPILVR